MTPVDALNGIVFVNVGTQSWFVDIASEVAKRLVVVVMFGRWSGLSTVVDILSIRWGILGEA